MNLVNQLQESAEQDDVLTVLRKTKRLASKLGREDIDSWLKAEQEGYQAAVNDVTFPDYRNVGTTLALNTNGYVPMGFNMVANGVQDLPQVNLDLMFDVREPISTVLSWIEAIDRGLNIYNAIPEGTELSRTLRGYVGLHGTHANQVSFMLHLDGARIKAIPERIKDRVLEWACALEAAGVTGDGLSFSAAEKQIASSVTFNISNSHIEQLTNTGSNQRGTE